MDSITHIALGAIIGEAYAGKEVGKRMMIIGALAQSVPDIDFVASFWLSPVDNLLAHRGFAHSFLFGALLSVLLGFALVQWGRPTPLTTRRWILFFGLEIAVHLFLDSLNNYGVGWFEPFSHIRVSFDVIFVADPFYSVWLGIGGIALLILHSKAPARRYWVTLSLAVSTLYLAYAFYNKSVIERDVKAALFNRRLPYSRVLTTPAPFNNWLWYYAAEADSGYYIGYRSVLDTLVIADLHYFPRQSALLESVKDQQALKKLLRFSQGYYTVENQHDTLVFNDLRFGQVAGWSNPHGNFAFHYYLDYPEANLLVVQRGRFQNWNRKTIGEFIHKIEGH
jgi:inner membrane protein